MSPFAKLSTWSRSVYSLPPVVFFLDMPPIGTPLHNTYLLGLDLKGRAHKSMCQCVRTPSLQYLIHLCTTHNTQHEKKKKLGFKSKCILVQPLKTSLLVLDPKKRIFTCLLNPSFPSVIHAPNLPPLEPFQVSQRQRVNAKIKNKNQIKTIKIAKTGSIRRQFCTERPLGSD